MRIFLYNCRTYIIWLVYVIHFRLFKLGHWICWDRRLLERLWIRTVFIFFLSLFSQMFSFYILVDLPRWRNMLIIIWWHFRVLILFNRSVSAFRINFLLTCTDLIGLDQWKIIFRSLINFHRFFYSFFGSNLIFIVCNGHWVAGNTYRFCFLLLTFTIHRANK